jgi:hypothetical protein
MTRSAIALSVSILALLACSGMADDVVGGDEPVVDGGEEGEEEEEEEEAKSPEDRIQGSWALQPGEKAIRTFQIMQAGASGKKKMLEKLGKLDAGEQSLLDSIEKKTAKDKESLVELIKMMKSVRYKIEGDKITRSVDGNDIGTDDVTIEDATDESMHMIFKGPYSETHWYITWKDDDTADVDVQYEGSELKLVHKLKRKE